VPGDGWQEEYKERVLAEFKRVHEDIEKLGDKIDKLKDEDISGMKIQVARIEQENKDKARNYGFIAGIASSIFVSLLIWMIEHLAGK
jgi:hypothetical protein